MTAVSKTQRGFDKFEFLVIVAIAGVAALVLLDRLLGMERESERTEVMLTIRNIRVGLQLAVGEYLMRDQEDRLPEILEADPTVFLGRLPRGYTATDNVAQDPGSWGFNPASRVLSYRPRQPEAFGGATELRWKLAGQRSSYGRMVGIRLESLPN